MDVDHKEPPSPTARFHDGMSSRRRIVALVLGEHLDIVEDGQVIASWLYADVRRVEAGAGLRLRSVSGAPLARLEIEHEAAAALLMQRCSALDDDVAEIQTGRIIGWSLAATASIVAMVFLGIPFAAERLAPLLPHAAEARLGEAVDKSVRASFGGKVCTTAAGQAALDELTARLDSGPAGISIQPRVLDADLQNAYTLPGGRIYLFKGLLEQSRDLDEIAGIMAHEIGHVRSHHITKALIQSGGTSFLLGLLFGDLTGSSVVLTISASLLDASHSRDAERAADDYAVQALVRLGRSATPFGDFLRRVSEEDEKGTILDSHPVSAERLDRIRRTDRPQVGEPILSAEAWTALRTICPRPRTTPRKTMKRRNL
ncbi:M48 family metallopeptidase [Terrihabitans rhizophilus]|uniref:M48 family metallopeptidase n=1 Tax=Terrihabitans rhizophilus TaxID=3092662 RepID=A0ABU4RMB2_9HYPH|nr:M48 family metallopeptidase [Terrihabitans sp. PJ23]MDX6805368.1 M48 family metallopeptidase [Terrihabitans sp. PJ23]